MRSSFFAFLLAAFSSPFLSLAQTSNPVQPMRALSEGVVPSGSSLVAGNTVSVRELRIPEKAHRSFEKGTHLLAAGDATGSVAELNRAIAAYPTYYEAYYQLGTARLILRQGQDATDAFTKSIQLSDGRFAQPYFALSMILSHSNNFAEGDTLAKTGLSLEPNSLIGQFSLSWAEMGLGRMSVAEKTLRDVLLRKENFRQARLLLTEIDRRQNNLAEVVADVEAYLKLDSTSPTSAQLRTLRDVALRSLAQSESNRSFVAAARP